MSNLNQVLNMIYANDQRTWVKIVDKDDNLIIKCPARMIAKLDILIDALNSEVLEQQQAKYQPDVIVIKVSK